MRIGDLNLGKIDGKFEFRESEIEGDDPFAAFLIPENVEYDRLNNKEKYYVYGFRGTGKTSLLRWVAHQKKREGALVDFVLFKTNITENERLELSNQVGFNIQELDAGKMEFSQDFKVAWKWFILHRLAEVFNQHPFLRQQDHIKKIIRLAGVEISAYRKVLGFLPRMTGLNFNISGELGFFKTELGAEFEARDDGTGKTSLPALIDATQKHLEKAEIRNTIFIYIDELEVFYDEHSKYTRDQRMVRDLLFITSQMNEFFVKNGLDIHIISAVRSEIVEGMGSVGQEVDRLVYDQGVKINWHLEKRSMEHPLFEMIARKIKNSDPECEGLSASEVISNYFPLMVRSEPIDQYLLDRSFYRPRDLIWRLTIIQEQFPNQEWFDDLSLMNTENEYSKKMWAEIAYELSANYSAQEIEAIEMLISGTRDKFELHHIEMNSNRLLIQSEKMRALLERVGVIDILQDLYRLGAVGNFFREGPSGGDIRNRWAFRGDPTLLPNKQMTINFCLHKRLSIIRERRRGSKGSGRNQSE